MKKFLLPILLSGFLSISANAQNQDQTISFETSEGYNLGNLLGQQNWGHYGYLFDNYANVIDSDASVGSQAVKVNANEDEQENWGGLIYELPSLQKFIISADVKFDGDMGSDYDMLSLYNFNGDDYEYLSGFYFVYTGETSFGSETNTTSPFDWTPNTWYNLKSDVDFSQRQIKLYVNNTLVNTVAIPQEINSINEVDFEFDNYETGFTLDNFQIIDLVNLGLNDINSASVHIYPNPTTDVLNIKSDYNIKSLEVLDLTSKTILVTKNSNQIDVKNLNKGIYLLKIESEKGTSIQKFIKK
ncbi:T9SS type A sorting domain-containing protein [Faecalibacter macacae]|uniref:T9SS C-terminal target domain-containing protein n=1 Tax=Faecalibacter macacae TaxID=1859289 RepID=A0A3L9M871_9FLAO|nr:T9SS type A sorting domain-containing protein [Faecalibacter macacae]RLZ09280.1 T9SS C-terminal target domain-containing protein [Faecalibacter macacae]